MHSNAAARILTGAGKVSAEKGVIQPRSRTIRDLKYGPASRLSQTVIPVLNHHRTSQHTQVSLQVEYERSGQFPRGQRRFSRYK
jgi:hypothetical protein